MAEKSDNVCVEIRTGEVIKVFELRNQGDNNDGIGVYEIRLSNPRKRNAMGKAFWSEFPESLKWVEDKRDARVVFITAEGPAFSAGIDLMYANEQLTSPATTNQEIDTARRALRLRQFVKYLQSAFNAIENCRFPVVASVAGVCFGSAVDLLTACDIRVASKDSVLSVKEVDVGIAADLGTLQRLQKIVGNDSWVREVCFTGRTFSADEAYRVGLVSSVESDNVQARAKAIQLSQLIATKSPIAIAGTKYGLNYSRDRTTAEGLNMQSVWNSAMLQTNDVGIAASLEFSKSSTDVKTKSPFSHL